MLKLQNIYPFTKCQGLDKCLIPFIIYVHKQCDFTPIPNEFTIHTAALSVALWCLSKL